MSELDIVVGAIITAVVLYATYCAGYVEGARSVMDGVLAQRKEWQDRYGLD